MVIPVTRPAKERKEMECQVHGRLVAGSRLPLPLPPQSDRFRVCRCLPCPYRVTGSLWASRLAPVTE
jgi:hypothetical protein